MFQNILAILFILNLNKYFMRKAEGLKSMEHLVTFIFLLLFFVVVVVVVLPDPFLGMGARINSAESQ